MDLGLNNRVYLVTGASRGLGYAAAQRLVAEGARVVLCARTPDPLARAVAALAAIETTIPIGRLGTPEEFGTVAAFVLSPVASYLTGVAVPIDGGAGRVL